MNKTELVDAIAAKSGAPKATVTEVLDAFQEVATETVAAGDDKITLPGFLSIERRATSARAGRNPATGAAIDIPAGHTAKIAAGSKLKAAAKG